MTSHNIRGVLSGVGEEGLTADQGAAISRVAFDASAFDAVYCSPARRCRETARLLGVDGCIVDPRLAERHFGVFEGLSVEQCREAYPVEFERFARLDAEFRIPGGESRADHFARFAEWVNVVAAHDHVLAITHGGIIDFLYRLGNDMPLYGVDGVHAGPNVALSVFDVAWPAVSVVRFGVALVE